ncbi:MAG: CYTH domain-containing protein [Pseudomonadales bacterium]|nr:CYTH domain-containing protein [Pseudomonadales bacterium]
MSSEIELKFLTTPEQLERLQTVLIAKEAQHTRQHLVNIYFDTPERLLQQHKVALRIRKAGERFIQTLKTKGKSVGGLHQRNEWEWDLDKPVLNGDYLATAEWPEQVSIDSLAPLFETNFVRTQFVVRHNGALFEVACDQGAVEAGGESSPICELELEIKEGTVPDLIGFAQSLLQQVGCYPSDISKGERGYYLSRCLEFKPGSARIKSAMTIAQFASYQVEQWIAGVDQFILTMEPRFLAKSSHALSVLMQLDDAGLIFDAGVACDDVTFAWVAGQFDEHRKLLEQIMHACSNDAAPTGARDSIVRDLCESSDMAMIALAIMEIATQSGLP